MVGAGGGCVARVNMMGYSVGWIAMFAVCYACVSTSEIAAVLEEVEQQICFELCNIKLSFKFSQAEIYR